MLTYSGRQIKADNDISPTVLDVAVHLGRLCRYGGGSRIFYPVQWHSMAVADLLRTDPLLEFYGLFHDGAESVISDIPRGFKNEGMKDMEHNLQSRIWKEAGVSAPTLEQWSIVKQADIAIMEAEAFLVAPAGVQDAMNSKFDPQTVRIVDGYLLKYRAEDAINPVGRSTIDFMERAEGLLRSIQSVRFDENCGVPHHDSNCWCIDRGGPHPLPIIARKWVGGKG